MKKIKVLSVFGTRPEGIKMCPLIKCIESDRRFESIVCVTAQHREMLDEVLNVFDVKPDYDLNIMSNGQTIIEISNKVLSGVDRIIKIVKPDIVLVHGDTSTTLNSALAAFYNKIPIGHIEAGLRTNDKYSPFPEEMNRRLTSGLADLHFAPTFLNKDNLLKEGIRSEKIFITGNTVIDALHSVVNKNISFREKILNDIDYENKKVILLTTHRRENLGNSMQNIFKAILRLINEREDVEIIFPMHKNPMIRSLAYEYFGKFKNRVHLLETIEYIEFINLMERVNIIMTDSGGIQEEGVTLGKPVIVLREKTERQEAVKTGIVTLGGTNSDYIYSKVLSLIGNKENYDRIVSCKNTYGDGNACKRIINHIYEYFISNNSS